MQLDKRMLEKLLTMNDAQLSQLISGIAKEAGIDPRDLGLNPSNLQSVRQALGSADDADLKRLNEIYNTYKESRRS